MVVFRYHLRLDMLRQTFIVTNLKFAELGGIQSQTLRSLKKVLHSAFKRIILGNWTIFSLYSNDNG